jgi:hypothetical protein
MSASNEIGNEINNEIINKVGNIICNNIKTICTPTGNFEKDKERAENYAKNVGMDKANADMLVVMATEGLQSAAKAMMEDCGNDYSAMRSRYG